MAYDNKPPLNNIPFRFSESGYSPPDLEQLEFDFAQAEAGSAIGHLKASIQAMALEYDRVKSCPTYTVGYGTGHVQIIKGPCTYEAARVLNAFINGQEKEIAIGDLPAFIRQVDSGTKDLPASLRVWQYRDLWADVRGLTYRDLLADIYGIPPSDLPAYIKPWPQEDLPVDIHGWEQRDLPAYLKAFTRGYRDLSAYLNVIAISNLPIIIRGWVSTYRDLGGFIRAVRTKDLPAYIKGTELSDLPGYIFGVAPRDLPADIHGWQEADLPAYIKGLGWPWNLTADITGSGGWRNLPAYVKAMVATEVPRDLPASTHGWQEKNLRAQIYGDVTGILWASITATGQTSDLHATIRPKMIKLTSVISVATMEHSDLSATVNVCFGTGKLDLSAYLRPVFKSDLSAFIRALYFDYKPRVLPAKIGYTLNTTTLDKYNLSIIIRPGAYWTEDIYSIATRIYNNAASLSAYIKGDLRYTGLTADITGTSLSRYNFGDTTIKNREQVVWTDYAGVFEKYETVEMAFSEMVKEYYYSSAGDYAWKKDKLERWVLRVASYVPANTALNIKRKLHKAMHLADMSRFRSVDDAMKYAIAYVTEYPQADLQATLVAQGTFRRLMASINPMYTQTDNKGLKGSITGIAETIYVGRDDGKFETF
jgi:hypothetical protein